MQIVIAGRDPSNIEDYLIKSGHKVKSFYVNDICLDIAKAFNPEVFIYMEDVVDKIPHEQALKQLQDYRVLIIATKENPVIPYAAALGIKDFVFQPCELETVLSRIEHPATISEAAELLRHAPNLIIGNQEPKKTDETKDNKKKSELSPPKEKKTREPLKVNLPSLHSEKSIGSILQRKYSQLISKKNEAQKTEKTKEKKEAVTVAFLKNNFVKTGYIRNGAFAKFRVNGIEDLLFQAGDDWDAVVIPATWGVEAVKEFRRNICSKTMLLIVLNGTDEHLSCGADYCIKKVTKPLAREISHVGAKTKMLWKRVDSDSLTGLYSRGFMEQWLAEQTARNIPLSMVLIDIDHFKKINDNYGHPAGDAVLSALGDFIRQNIRRTDIAFRYGGEKFVIALPYTDGNQTYILIDHIRKIWSEKSVQIPDGASVQTTFTAEVAEWQEGCDIKQLADNMLYKAKNEGRNQVQTDKLRNRALILGKFSTDILKENGIDITYDPEQASIAVAEKNCVTYAPEGIPLYVLGAGDMSDWLIKRERSDAVICKSLVDVVDKLTVKPKLQVLPGVRTCEKSQTITKHGAIYVACPSRPAAAGEIAVDLCNTIRNVALVCASPESTGALAMGISEKALITADWRIPNADAPLVWGGVTVWPVDPFKHLPTNYDVQKLVDEIKFHFSLVIVDCGGNLDVCSRIAADEAVLLIHREGDATDAATGYWLKLHNNRNVMAIAPSEEPEITEAENGFMIGTRRAADNKHGQKSRWSELEAPHFSGGEESDLLSFKENYNPINTN